MRANNLTMVAPCHPGTIFGILSVEKFVLWKLQQQCYIKDRWHITMFSLGAKRNVLRDFQAFKATLPPALQDSLS